jgi:hypothetical protein
MHPRIPARGAFAKTEQHQRSTGGTLAPEATRWHVNAPGGLFHPQDFLPCRRIPLLRVNRQDLVAFARNHDVDTSPPREPFPQFVRDIGRVHSPWQLRAINPFTKQCRLELGQHAYEQLGFGCMITTLLCTKQQRQRPCDMMEGAHHTKSVLTANDLMRATTLPAPCTA